MAHSTYTSPNVSSIWHTPRGHGHLPHSPAHVPRSRAHVPTCPVCVSRLHRPRLHSAPVSMCETSIQKCPGHACSPHACPLPGTSMQVCPPNLTPESSASCRCAKQALASKQDASPRTGEGEGTFSHRTSARSSAFPEYPGCSADAGEGSCPAHEGHHTQAQDAQEPVNSQGVAKSQPGGCRLIAGATLPSVARHLLGRLSCPALRMPSRTRLSCRSGAWGGPGRDSGCLWQSPGPASTFSQRGQQHSSPERPGGPTPQACCRLRGILACLCSHRLQKSHSMSLPGALSLCCPCHVP